MSDFMTAYGYPARTVKFIDTFSYSGLLPPSPALELFFQGDVFNFHKNQSKWRFFLHKYPVY
ncbi:hypothetical protein JCM17843_07680 [Kordiimonadales bacterium JCM 17843]|nr:hypothetical protein JCM17843_07680 [Kordiimonadales bacterium JCM 17843]